MSRAERIDRRVFADLWPRATPLERKFLRWLYQPCYPKWPEFQ